MTSENNRIASIGASMWGSFVMTLLIYFATFSVCFTLNVFTGIMSLISMTIYASLLTAIIIWAGKYFGLFLKRARASIVNMSIFAMIVPVLLFFLGYVITLILCVLMFIWRLKEGASSLKESSTKEIVKEGFFMIVQGILTIFIIPLPLIILILAAG